MPTIRRLQNIPIHGLPKPRLILLRTRNRRPIPSTPSKTTVFNPGLQFLVPGIGTHDVDDTDDEFLARFVHGDHEGVVHYVVALQEEGVVENCCAKEFLGMLKEGVSEN